jgi:translation initiation factor 2 subunit 3
LSVINNNIQDKLIICINKIDLVNKEVVKKKKIELDKILSELNIEPYSVIPICINKNINVNIVKDKLFQMLPIESYIDRSSYPLDLYIIRSFDINKPGTNIAELKGGILGGSIKSGIIKVGDKIKINDLVGIITEIRSDNIVLSEANNGGLIAIGTDIDPSFTKSNKLAHNFIIKL